MCSIQSNLNALYLEHNKPLKHNIYGTSKVNLELVLTSHFYNSFSHFFQSSKCDISTLDRLCRSMNGKTNGINSEGIMVHSLLDDEHAEAWKPEIPFENVS